MEAIATGPPHINFSVSETTQFERSEAVSPTTIQRNAFGGIIRSHRQVHNNNKIKLQTIGAFGYRRLRLNRVRFRIAAVAGI